MANDYVSTLNNFRTKMNYHSIDTEDIVTETLVAKLVSPSVVSRKLGSLDREKGFSENVNYSVTWC